MEGVKYRLQRKHRLPDICSQASRAGNYLCRSSRHAHRTRCNRPYKCVTRNISNELFIIPMGKSDFFPTIVQFNINRYITVYLSEDEQKRTCMVLWYAKNQRVQSISSPTLFGHNRIRLLKTLCHLP